MFTSILYNSHFLKYCETRHHHLVFFQDIEETEAFGGLDSCSGVKCTGAGLLGLGTYDWKTLGRVSVKRTYSTNLPKNPGQWCISAIGAHPSFFSREDFWEKEHMELSMNFWGLPGIKHPDLGWGMEAKVNSPRKRPWGICVPQPCHASGMWKHHHCWNLEYHGFQPKV